MRDIKWGKTILQALGVQWVTTATGTVLPSCKKLTILGMVHSRTQILISSHLFLHYSLMTHENHSILKMTWGANTAELCTEGQIFTPLELSAIQLWTIPLLISGHHCHSWGEGRVKQNTRNHSCYLSSPLAVWSKRKSWPKRRNCWVAAEQPSHSITRNTNKQTKIKNKTEEQLLISEFCSSCFQNLAISLTSHPLWNTF